jgi:hypothetical protein
LKHRLQHVGVIQIELAGFEVRAWFYTKLSTFLIIQDGGKYAGRIESRQTAPINGTIPGYKGC